MVCLLSRKFTYIVYKKSYGYISDPFIFLMAIGYYEKFYGIDERHFTYLEEI